MHGIDPRLPALLWALTALTLLATALTLWPGLEYGRLSGWWRRAPRAIGGVAGASIALGGWWLGRALGLAGLAGLLLILVAMLLALLVGVYLPGMPARAFARRRGRLLLQTIDLAGYLRFVVEGSLGDVGLLRGYVRRRQRPIADAQAIIDATLLEIDLRRRGSVFAILLEQALASGSQPLIACCTALFHGAQNSRRALGPVLAQQREQLFDTLIEHIKQRAQRLELLLIAVSAAALAFGLLPCILFVMTGGGSLLGGLF